jgi:hypothetical protein
LYPDCYRLAKTLVQNMYSPELLKLVLPHLDKAILKDAARETCKPETPSREAVAITIECYGVSERYVCRVL